MKTLTKRELFALENMNLIMRAEKNGLKVYPEDLLINYAEIDLTLTGIEETWSQAAAATLQSVFLGYMQLIEKESDIKPEESGYSAAFSALFMEFIRTVWQYGQDTAEQDLQTFHTYAEHGVSSRGNEGAFEWYQMYAKELGAQQEKAAFHYMQPLILEHLDQGTVGTKLTGALQEEFARYGPVRTEIIARTESNKAFNWGRRYKYDGSKALAGYRYSAILDGKTTELCQSLHGHSWEKDDPELDDHTPPNHYQCRSVLVPITKYVDYTFDPPPRGWDADLPDEEKKVFEKFKDSTFYPKAESVKEKPKPKLDPPKQVTKAAAPPKIKEPAKKKAVKDKTVKATAKKVSADVKPFIQVAQDKAKRDVARFLEINQSVSDTHPVIQNALQVQKDLESGMYEGKMIRAEYSKRSSRFNIHEYEQMNNLFYRVASTKIKKAERERMLGELRRVSADPRFIGVKVDLTKSKTVYGSYNISTDILEYTPEAAVAYKRQSPGDNADLGTLYHEIGHRVHGIEVITGGKTPWMEPLAVAGVTMSESQWKAWEKVVNPFWEPGKNRIGDHNLPKEVAARYEYPINAKQYYTKGTKKNFYKEMFAETTAVYLEGDVKEIQNVQNAYPGLLEFMEQLYKLSRL